MKDIEEYVRGMLSESRKASRVLATASTAQKDDALRRMADTILNSEVRLASANQ